MELIVLVVALLALNVLAPWFGVDSRGLDPRETRHWWFGA
jgi:hypothetical protein